MQLTQEKIREKLGELRAKRAEKEVKYRAKMRFYRGVIHESAASELKHQEVKVLESYLDSIDREIAMWEERLGQLK